MKTSIDYDNQLNAVQLQAVKSTEGPHLVIAGAGSGKTRLLVHRTAYLVEKGIDPSKILLLTFTRRAAQEMLKRASSLLDDRCQSVSGGTFHSFANKTLRRYAEHCGLSRFFAILDQDDSESIIQSLRVSLGLNKADKRFPKKKIILSILSKAVNKCVDVETMLYEEYPLYIEWLEIIKKIQGEYIEYKKSRCLLDYDDLLVSLRDLLLNNREIREELSGQFEYVMVDEYQDTNKIQAQIIKALMSTHQNIMVVGDDSQSIYSFRGAHFKNIIDFPQDFPSTKIIKLEENYRSSQPILDLTNEVIKSAHEKFDKVLFTNNKGRSLPVYVDVARENDQSKYIVRKVVDLVSDGVPLKEIAILFRSGWHSNDLEIELASQGIGFLKYGGQKFIEAAHVKDVMSYLQVAFQPRNDISWSRILTLLPGVGPQTAKAVIKTIATSANPFGSHSAPIEKNEMLRELLKLYAEIHDKKIEPAEMVKIFNGYYLPLLKDKYDDYEQRINDLDSLEKIASRYTSLEAFISDMALDPPEKSLVNAARDIQDDSKLTLSTIHSAKGLEWHTVFLLYVAEGYLPSYRSMDSQEAIEEERRLFYVATTRAKKRLYLLRPQIDRSPSKSYGNKGGWSYTRISRFLGERSILHRFVEVESAPVSNYVDFLDDYDVRREIE